jgi:hypothetical protein
VPVVDVTMAGGYLKGDSAEVEPMIRVRGEHRRRVRGRKRDHACADDLDGHRRRRGTDDCIHPADQQRISRLASGAGGRAALVALISFIEFHRDARDAAGVVDVPHRQVYTSVQAGTE